MTPLEWARSVKPELVALQRRTGIPALWAGAQHCHEGFNVDGSMSGLLANDSNGAGLKFSLWQTQYGCTPVTYKTEEWDDARGIMIQVDAEFCHCPDMATWWQVYAHLLSFDLYRPAYQYKADPFLFGAAIWAAGYATDPQYLAGRDSNGGVTGVLHWLLQLWPDYADTLPSFIAKAPAGTPAKVFLPGMRDMAPGVVTADGQTWAQLEDGTWIPLRITAEAMDRKATWFGPGRGGPLAIVS